MFVRLVIVLFFFISCDSEKKTFFSGKILNKTSNYISVFKDNIIISESVVDTAGAFLIEIDNLEEGLYTFYHEPEFQYLIIDRYDNLRIRLNTLDFDESLVFSGSNEETNNFLLDLFLATEVEDSDMYSEYYELEPLEFLEKIKSLKQQKVNKLNELNAENLISNQAINFTI